MEERFGQTVLQRVDQGRKLLAMVKTRKLKYFGHIYHATPHSRKRSCSENKAGSVSSRQTTVTTSQNGKTNQ